MLQYQPIAPPKQQPISGREMSDIYPRIHPSPNQTSSSHVWFAIFDRGRRRIGTARCAMRYSRFSSSLDPSVDHHHRPLSRLHPDIMDHTGLVRTPSGRLATLSQRLQHDLASRERFCRSIIRPESKGVRPRPYLCTRGRDARLNPGVTAFSLD